MALITMYLHSKDKYNVLIVFILYCLLLRWDMGKVRDRLMVWVGLSVIINVITDVITWVFF